MKYAVDYRVFLADRSSVIVDDYFLRDLSGSAQPRTNRNPLRVQKKCAHRCKHGETRAPVTNRHKMAVHEGEFRFSSLYFTFFAIVDV